MKTHELLAIASTHTLGSLFSGSAVVWLLAGVIIGMIVRGKVG